MPQILHHSRKRILERRGPAGARPYPGGGGETSPCRVSLRAASPPDTAPRAPPLRLYGQTAQPTPTPPQHSTAQQPTRGTATDPGAAGRGGARRGVRRRGGRAPAADASGRRGPCPRPRNPPPRHPRRAAPPPRVRRSALTLPRARAGPARTSPSSRTLATPSTSQRSSISHDSNGTHSDSCGTCARLSIACAPAGARAAGRVPYYGELSLVGRQRVEPLLPVPLPFLLPCGAGA